ncbi:hypothetical protein KDN24_06840 [Bacillus sp. Bva_UNVM-123]|uniref:hypothetical protein n=1 Tax=Bacillus sp. Bva_UNVM-123 TaxID=2829798 RepID=UPI00391F0F70
MTEERHVRVEQIDELVELVKKRAEYWLWSDEYREYDEQIKEWYERNRVWVKQ